MICNGEIETASGIVVSAPRVHFGRVRLSASVPGAACLSVDQRAATEVMDASLGPLSAIPARSPAHSLSISVEASSEGDDDAARPSMARIDPEGGASQQRGPLRRSDTAPGLTTGAGHPTPLRTTSMGGGELCRGFLSGIATSSLAPSPSPPLKDRYPGHCLSPLSADTQATAPSIGRPPKSPSSIAASLQDGVASPGASESPSGVGGARRAERMGGRGGRESPGGTDKGLERAAHRGWSYGGTRSAAGSLLRRGEGEGALDRARSMEPIRCGSSGMH